MVMPMPAKIAHLEMIQGVVNRLAHSSALLKGWSALLAFLPAVVFWGLDWLLSVARAPIPKPL